MEPGPATIVVAPGFAARLRITQLAGADWCLAPMAEFELLAHPRLGAEQRGVRGSVALVCAVVLRDESLTLNGAVADPASVYSEDELAAAIGERVRERVLPSVLASFVPRTLALRRFAAKPRAADAPIDVTEVQVVLAPRQVWHVALHERHVPSPTYVDR